MNIKFSYATDEKNQKKVIIVSHKELFCKIILFTLPLCSMCFVHTTYFLFLKLCALPRREKGPGARACKDTSRWWLVVQFAKQPMRCTVTFTAWHIIAIQHTYISRLHRCSNAPKRDPVCSCDCDAIIPGPLEPVRRIVLFHSFLGLARWLRIILSMKFRDPLTSIRCDNVSAIAMAPPREKYPLQVREKEMRANTNV